MGQCYFIIMKWGKPELKEVRSEDFMEWIEENAQTEMNTAKGIWFYELDLFDVPKLKKQLKELIKEIDKVVKEAGY